MMKNVKSSYWRAQEFKRKVTENVFTGLNRQYKQNRLFDVTVAIGTESFECHRLILASVSDFFDASLREGWSDDSSRHICIDHSDVTADSFRLFLDVIYTGKDVVTMNNAKDILRMAIFLQVGFLQKDVETYLSQNMEPETCFGIWQFADKYDLKLLSRKAAEMAITKFEKACTCDEYLSVPTAVLLITLSSVTSSMLTNKNSDAPKEMDYLSSVREAPTTVTMDCIFFAILRWVEYDPDSRRVYLAELLPFVCFPQLTPGCLNEAVKYLSHPFKDDMSDYIQEALKFRLVGTIEDNNSVKRQILARQTNLLETPDIGRYLVLVGGTEETDKKPTRRMSAFPLGSEDSRLTHVQPMPDEFGPNFASCVWRNELYVSGGTGSAEMLAVYKPGFNQWETLTQMPSGREHHSMAAVNWKIYVVGGYEKGVTVDLVPSSDIMVYSIKNKTWTRVGRLPMAVVDTTAAVLGHRIYVVGGRDVLGSETDLVQCVSTKLGQGCEAGRLPFPTAGARAVSDGGTIYVAAKNGQVLRMKENFALADERENMGQVPLESGEVQGIQGDMKTDLSMSGDVVSSLSTVSFETIGRFPARDKFGVYLHGHQLVVCGGEKTLHSPLCDQMAFDLNTEKLSHKVQTLVTGRAGFDVHVLNLPKEFLEEECVGNQATMRFCFSSPLQDGLELKSKTTTVGKFNWFITVGREEESIQLYLYMEKQRRGNRRATTHFEAHLVPAMEIAPSVFRFSEYYEFTDQKAKGRGWPEFASLDTLQEPDSPYLHDGMAMVEYTIEVDMSNSTV